MDNLSAAASLQKTDSPFLVAPIANSSSVGVGLHGHLPTPHWVCVWLHLAQILCRLSQQLWVHMSTYSVAFPLLVLLIFSPSSLLFPEPWEEVGRYRCPSRAKTMQPLILWALTGFRSLSIVTPVLDLTAAYAQFWSEWFEMIPKNYS